jgi:GAF domain-containing protein
MSITIYQPPAEHPREALRAKAIDQSGILSHAGSRVLQRIVCEARDELRSAKAAITIISHDWQYLLVAAGLPATIHSRRTSFCGHAIHEPTEIFLVPDASRDRRFAGNPLVVEPAGIRFYAGAVLEDERQLPFGTLCVFDHEPRAGLLRSEAATLRRLAAEAVAELRYNPAAMQQQHAFG